MPLIASKITGAKATPRSGISTFDAALHINALPNSACHVAEFKKNLIDVLLLNGYNPEQAVELMVLAQSLDSNEDLGGGKQMVSALAATGKLGR